MTSLGLDSSCLHVSNSEHRKLTQTKAERAGSCVIQGFASTGMDAQSFSQNCAQTDTQIH